MRTKVTEQGVLILKRLIEGVDEVEIRQEQHMIVVAYFNNHGYHAKMDCRFLEPHPRGGVPHPQTPRDCQPHVDY